MKEKGIAEYLDFVKRQKLSKNVILAVREF